MLCIDCTKVKYDMLAKEKKFYPELKLYMWEAIPMDCRSLQSILHVEKLSLLAMLPTIGVM
ncbi:hypothetical protein A3L21_10005 [Pantoea agglomerans]|nr:hypothetical protein A3L21_10005 [Pantoea agglomerans]